MNTVLDNLISLLDDGAFGSRHEIEPMTAFKWGVLYKISVIEDVVPIVFKAIVAHESDKHLDMPYEIKVLFAKGTFSEKDGVSLNFDFEDLEMQNLNYIVKKYVLKDIVYKERHSIDTSKISLDFLGLILQNANIILRHGIRLRGMIELGVFLKTKGQLVDFVKVESWIQRLKLKKMASLQASVLTELFSLETDEFPYIKKFDKHAQLLTDQSLMRTYKANKFGRSFGKYNITNCVRFYSYSHSESLCKIMSNISKSLSEIEE